MKSILPLIAALISTAYGTTRNITAYGAHGDGVTLNTRTMQAAIDACQSGDVVMVPAGTFLTGALFLKSDLTLQLEQGAVLQGSTDLHQYEPMIRNRFEGWELDTYASLLNAGRLDHGGACNVQHLVIRGSGTIRGGGAALAHAMIAAHGKRSRGRLICVMNCDGLTLDGVTVEESPCWTIHYIYSRNVICRNLTVHSSVENGDGIDPDSSRDCLISHCSFATGDDCIAVKSGKNPEGGEIGIPTENLEIRDCEFLSGHGISIGSEMSGGVRHVVVADCRAGNLKNGLQIKGAAARGGVVEDIIVRHCQLQKIRVLTAVNYNNDGAPAPAAPFFRELHFSQLDLSQASVAEPVIIVDGFDSAQHRTTAVTFDQVTLPAGAVVQLDQCSAVSFLQVTTAAGAAPHYRIARSKGITVDRAPQLNN